MKVRDRYVSGVDDGWAIEEIFDDDYLYFYAQRLTDAASDAEAALAWELAGLGDGSQVLDLACGHGRIANRLGEMGAVVTGLDATPLFLEQARADAARAGIVVDYVEGDMRALPWTERFDAVLCWFTAYGYFDDAQNQAVLAEVWKALKRGGRFVIELNHKDALVANWLPSFVIERDGDTMVDQQVFDPLTGRSTTQRMVLRDGGVRRAWFSTRLFSFTELRDWLIAAGFTAIRGHGGDGSELTATSRRMIVVATK
jgi:SAM-dependent methyltransferase